MRILITARKEEKDYQNFK